MELTPKQQIVELLKEAQNILVLTHQNSDGDGLGSILALTLALQKLGKNATAVSLELPLVAFSFLPQLALLKQDFQSNKDFIVTLNTLKTQVEKLGYKNLPSEHKLNIIITPNSGSFVKEDVSFAYGSAKVDLIFILDSPTLERLGPFKDTNSDLFYQVPTINIDHHAGNDHFGKVNWIDLTATSTAEILVSLLESISKDKPLLDEDIATCLLTGITTDTNSFQNQNTTPKALTVAAQLVAAGAHQQDIIRSVYKTKPLTTLKLWGKILSRVYEEQPHRFIYSTVYIADFAEIGAQQEETSGVIDELLKTAPNIDFVLLLSERRGGVHGSLRAIERNLDIAQIAALFGGGGHSAAAAFEIPNSNLAQSLSPILEKIKNFQAERLGLGVQQQIEIDKPSFS